MRSNVMEERKKGLGLWKVGFGRGKTDGGKQEDPFLDCVKLCFEGDDLSSQ